MRIVSRGTTVLFGAMTDAPLPYDGREDAIGDLLQTLGRAPFDLEPLLATILHHAVRLCRADRGFIYLLDDGLYRHAADVGASPEIVASIGSTPFDPREAR
jgi:hypothetical protein